MANSSCIDSCVFGSYKFTYYYWHICFSATEQGPSVSLSCIHHYQIRPLCRNFKVRILRFLFSNKVGIVSTAFIYMVILYSELTHTHALVKTYKAAVGHKVMPSSAKPYMYGNCGLDTKSSNRSPSSCYLSGR